ncbi:MAG: hypothetical protein ACRC3Y_15645 [Romboutsia sp.]|uniref:hypothetical protein n=1 Tax=Romboutsia sp. TaxID=1965302 RepID=UPI003F3248BE
MGKSGINANFENLKAEMMKKKEVAKEVNETTIKTENVNKNKNANKNVNNFENEVVSQEDEDVVSSGISSNKIVIKKAQKVQPPKRITYYLNQDTIKRIDKYSKMTGMGKSEFVQTLLDISLNNLEIE